MGLLKFFRKFSRLGAPIISLTDSIYHPTAKSASEIFETSNEVGKAKPAGVDPQKKKPAE